SAKTLAYATGCALVAVPTFAVVAEQAPPEAVVLDVIADAQQDKVYVQRFARDGTSAAWHTRTPLTIRQIVDWLTDRQPDVWVTGPGLQAVRGRLPEQAPVAAAQVWEPQPASLLRVGMRQYLRGDVDDCWTVEPLYLRPSSAEQKRQGR